MRIRHRDGTAGGVSVEAARAIAPVEFCTDPQRNPEKRRSEYDG
jgi:hypothetical protein